MEAVNIPDKFGTRFGRALHLPPPIAEQKKAMAQSLVLLGLAASVGVSAQNACTGSASVFDMQLTSINGTSFNTSSYQGSVAIFLNVASF